MLQTLCTDWKMLYYLIPIIALTKMIYSYIVHVQNINDNNKSKLYRIFLLTVLHSYPKIVYLYKNKRK